MDELLLELHFLAVHYRGYAAVVLGDVNGVTRSMARRMELCRACHAVFYLKNLQK
jgi:hypothetical protein